MKKEIPWELIISALKQDISDADGKRLEEWLSVGENREVYEELRGVWEKIRVKVVSYTPDVDFYWKEMMQRMKECEEAENLVVKKKSTLKSFRRALVLSMKYAAVFCVLIAGTFFVTKHYMSEEFGKKYTVVTAPKGQRVKVDLPDGTVAWLSPCSQLRFSGSFNNKDRIVELDGATFFDVAKNPDKPFVVAVKQYRVQVLGTKFNISAYAASPEFETDLLEGAVYVYDSTNAGNEILLKPKEKAVLWGDKLVKRPSDFNNEEYLKNGIVTFQSESFGKVINQVALWNGVHFTIKKTVDLTKKISGKFRQSDTVESILKALQGTTPFKYTIIDENEIIIY